MLLEQRALILLRLEHKEALVFKPRWYTDGRTDMIRRSCCQVSGVHRWKLVGTCLVPFDHKIES